MALEKQTYKGTNHFNSDELIEKVLEKMAAFKVPAKLDNNAAWNNVLNSVNSQKQTKTISLYYKLSIAATICLLIGVAWLTIYFIPEKYVSSRGEQLTVLLPDSSEVLLNAESEIKFNKKLWKSRRKVWMQGEVFFRVTKGNQFDVITDKGIISVLGTQFNVFARNKSLKVYCKTGKVSVKTENRVILTSGLETNVDELGVVSQPYKTDSAKALAWQNGEFWFSNAPINNVLEELERQFNISIEYSYKENRKYSGYFTKDDLKQALDLVCIPMQFKYEIINNKVVIK